MIARLTILNFAPKLANGKKNSLALLFDMNLLLKVYVLVYLKNAAKDIYLNSEVQR